MRSALIRTLLGLLVTSGTAFATESNFNVMLGGKILDHDDWDPVEDQSLLAVQIDIRPSGWPVAIAVNMMGSSDYDRRTVANVGTVETYGGVTELQVGVAGLLALRGHTTLYAGAGGSFGSALSESWTAASERTSWGYGAGTWAHAGVFWTFGSFNIGMGGGWSWVPMDLDRHYVDAGGWRFGLLLGGNVR